MAELAPGDLNRVFFVSGGSEAVESAWKLARQYYLARGGKETRNIVTPGARAGAQEPETMHDAIVGGGTTARRYKAVARRVAYHGTTFGALSINGIAAIRTPFEPLVPEVRHVATRTATTARRTRPRSSSPRTCSTSSSRRSWRSGPRRCAWCIMEPVQNAGGAFTPPAGYWKGVREICDRYDILLSADEVITGFGRLGHWFGSERYDIRPDIVCCAKGLSSSYAAIGAVIATDRVMEPFLEDTSMYTHGITFGGHPVMSAIALKNIEIMKREKIVERVADQQDVVRAKLEQLLDLPIVGDVRGTGFFYAHRAGQEQGDARDVLGRGVRAAAARLPDAADVRGGPDLPRRRPRRPGDPDLAAARRRRRRMGRARRDPRHGARGGLAADLNQVWWLEEAGPVEPARPLPGDTEADVAIVGGGFTGLWTALALVEREPGLDVVLLEESVCGRGPSGRNGGFCHGYWSHLPRLRERFGDEGARAVARAGAAIIPGVRAFCEAQRRRRLAARERDAARLGRAGPGPGRRRRGRGGARARRARGGRGALDR